MTLPRLLLFTATAMSLLAQTETGQIAGTVRGGDGHPISAASVELTSAATGFRRTASSSPKGVYILPELPPAEYTVRISAPDLAAAEVKIVVTAGARINRDFQLSAPIKGAAYRADSATGQVFTGEEIRALPNLTRNPYQFAALSGNVSDAGLGTRGVGLAIDGQRESSTNILLDGSNSNDEFNGAIGQRIPLDAVKEFSVLTGSFGAEYGRASGGIVNMVTRSGSNDLRGSAYEFNRVSDLASNSYQNNANGVKQQSFSRNQFGYAVGAPVLRDRLFVFSSTEGTRVDSNAAVFAWVPTSQLIAQSAPATQSFFEALGQLRSDARSLGTVTLNDLTAIYGKNPCTGLACATLPAGLPLFSHVTYNAPADAGAGLPQNTWNNFERVDYNLSDRTRIYGRYSIYSETDRSGSLSNSPYSNYDLGQTFFDQDFLVSASHIYSPSLISATQIAFTRLNNLQQGLTSRGVVPAMYANPNAPLLIGNDAIALPGYNPYAPGAGGTFGGPQNILQFHHDVTWDKGSHSFRFGGSYEYIRDNRTDAEYQTAQGALSNSNGLGPALNGFLAGQFAQITLAIDPQKPLVPAANPLSSGSSLLLGSSPAFSRSNRFHDGALYAQDTWKIKPRITVNLGVRWEHYGVQHNSNPNLDSNLYAPGVGFADNNLGQYLRTGSIQIASKSSVGGLYKPDWKDFAPRLGLAWDLSGNGKTVVRAGYGIGYERNFGNVTFNVIQNPPNYAILEFPGPVATAGFGPAVTNGTTFTLPPSGARIIDPDLKTAYAHFWSASVQRRITQSISYTIEYSGSKGVNLYSISYPNQIGFGNSALGDPCTGNGDCVSQPNASLNELVGYRGNQGFSNYQGVNNRVTMNNFLHLGMALTVNYTFSHAVDNISSTFFEAGGQGVQGQFGSQNITINNGDFDHGLLDPYHPNLDKGDAEFDIRHRVTAAGDWTIPFGRFSGWKGRILGGWSLTPIYTVRSGQPFSIFDSSTQTLDLNTPRAVFTGKQPAGRNTFVAGTTPDTFHIITLLPAQIAKIPNLLTPGAQFPAAMSKRDAFRAPGWWNLDLGIHKETQLTERFSLDLRAEAFNFLNHANLYVEGLTADVGSSNTVDACFGCSGSVSDRRQIQLGAKLIF